MRRSQRERLDLLVRSQSKDRLQLSQMKMEEQEAVKRLENVRHLKEVLESRTMSPKLIERSRVLSGESTHHEEILVLRGSPGSLST